MGGGARREGCCCAAELVVVVEVREEGWCSDADREEEGKDDDDDDDDDGNNDGDAITGSGDGKAGDRSEFDGAVGADTMICILESGIAGDLRVDARLSTRLLEEGVEEGVPKTDEDTRGGDMPAIPPMADAVDDDAAADDDDDDDEEEEEEEDEPPGVLLAERKDADVTVEGVSLPLREPRLCVSTPISPILGSALVIKGDMAGRLERMPVR